MVRKIENFFWIAFVGSLLVLVKSSSSNPVQNELLEELKAELKSLRVKIDVLEARNIENVELLTTKISKQEEEINKLKAKIGDKQEPGHPSEPLNDERNLHSNGKMGSTINKKEIVSGFSSTKALAPSSCRELSVLGHNLDGLYLVQNVDTKKIETVLCDFGTSVLQESRGIVDVKTKTVHFYVQKNSNFGAPNAFIPFELAPLNEGKAFDLTSGIFTVPVPGIYHFDCSAVKSVDATFLHIYLQVNGGIVGGTDTSHSATESVDVVSLSASLRLAAGDKVNLYNYNSGVISDDNINHFTHFTGWLVEEDLM